MLSGRVCLITGSTRGIGWATARLFAQHGAKIILNGCADQSLLDSRLDELRSGGAECSGFLSDASDPKAVSALYREIFSVYKRLDVLVNNAGIMRDALLGMVTEELARTTLEVNTLGPLMHLQEASRIMSRKKSGSIVNMTSILGRFGGEGQTVYSASKAAIIGMTMAAAKELASRQIRVNAIAPGFIDTDMTRQLPEAKIERAVGGVRMGRAGTPSDVANAALFLASDLSAYITGQILGVDGGMSI
jgi:3-oxoacyl-[acyl-carrier protein] reductase